jgi:hypothetical protein
MKSGSHGRGGTVTVTIAACYVSPEGVVLAADSASTYQFPTGPHHFNYGQKLFEIGNDSTLGIVTWGLGGLELGSYRTLVAKLGDDLVNNPATRVSEVADRWASLVWPLYSTLQDVQGYKALSAKLPFDPSTPPDPGRRTAQEEAILPHWFDRLVVGFCIGGYVVNDRIPAAFEIVFDPSAAQLSTPQQLRMAQSFWGVPVIIHRIIKGCGDEVRDAILASGKWSGTPHELDAVIAMHALFHPSTVPIREAIDFTHACLLATVKAMKFSALPRFCGGPIEIAVITTDRLFRWVQHKAFDAAIRESES